MPPHFFSASAFIQSRRPVTRSASTGFTNNFCYPNQLRFLPSDKFLSDRLTVVQLPPKGQYQKDWDYQIGENKALYIEWSQKSCVSGDQNQEYAHNK
jgi:hypothetical protein